MGGEMKSLKLGMEMVIVVKAKILAVCMNLELVKNLFAERWTGPWKKLELPQ